MNGWSTKPRTARSVLVCSRWLRASTTRFLRIFIANTLPELRCRTRTTLAKPPLPSILRVSKASMPTRARRPGRRPSVLTVPLEIRLGRRGELPPYSESHPVTSWPLNWGLNLRRVWACESLPASPSEPAGSAIPVATATAIMGGRPAEESGERPNSSIMDMSEAAPHGRAVSRGLDSVMKDRVDVTWCSQIRAAERVPADRVSLSEGESAAS
mmetsp:Transcript_2819/g.11338  ORF Transcript_2819/g.11338 Transcript_2819/m.11338 type:complete len:213 (-) Transcript_2819:1574-2212(-)